MLAPIGGKPFLWRLLHRLRSQGVTDIVLSTGYLGDQVADYAGDGAKWRLTLRCVQEVKPLGTGGAVRLAADTLGICEPVLVMNGDTFFGGSLQQLIAFHGSRSLARASIALVRVQDARRYGRVVMDQNEDAIRELIEKGTGCTGPAWVNAGMYVLDPAVVAGIETDRSVSLEREVFLKWTGAGLYGCRYPEAQFIDFGTPEDYARASSILPGYALDED